MHTVVVRAVLSGLLYKSIIAHLAVSSSSSYVSSEIIRYINEMLNHMTLSLSRPTQGNTVVVLFPDGAQVVVTYESKTTLLDLLPKINKQRRLRLYTDEYIFVVTTADQKALKVLYMCDFIVSVAPASVD